MCEECYLKLLDFEIFHKTCVENEKLWESLKTPNLILKIEFDEDFEKSRDDVLFSFSDAETDEEKPQVSSPKIPEKSKKISAITEKPKFKCDLCDKKYMRKDSVKRHITKYHLCNRIFIKKEKKQQKTKPIDESIKQKFEEEEQKIKDAFDLKCPKCDFQSQNFYEFKSHLRTIHHEINPGMVCCGKKIVKRRFLLDHITLHQDPDKLRCVHCTRIYSDFQSLKYHLARVHGSDDEKPFVCEPCGKRFIDFETLRGHMFVHLSEKTRENLRNYLCDICHKSFLRKSTLRKHVSYSHLNQGLMCTDCGRIFNSKFDYELHQRDKHGKEGPERLECNKCKKWYSNRRSLSVHIKHQHTILEAIPCAVCGKEYTNKTNLRKHMITNHMERAYKCDECPKAFPTASRLKEHVAMHTGVSLYNCPYCSNRSFNRRVNMYQHFKRMHKSEWERDKMRNKENSDRSQFAAKYKKD